MTTLAERLKSTRNGIFGALFKKNISIDNNIINELEDRFLLADTGVKTTDLIINALINEIKNKDIRDSLSKFLDIAKK